MGKKQYSTHDNPLIHHTKTSDSGICFRYHAFGQEIVSEIALPELLVSSHSLPGTIAIKMGKVPESLDSAKFSGVRFQASPGKLLIKADNVARYLILNGNQIIIEPFARAREEDIRLFLLGSAFGALFHQQGHFPLHGSAIVYNKNAIIFSGTSGAGKSTLAASFLKKGYQLLTDDICMISLKNKKPFIFPGYPNMKLWADTLDKMGENKFNLKKVREGIQKYAIPFTDCFHTEPLPLTGIYIISTKNSPGINLLPVKGIEKFNSIKNNTYRLTFLKGTGTTSSHFKHIEALSAHCFVKLIERPNKGFHLDELRELIENDLMLNAG